MADSMEPRKMLWRRPLLPWQRNFEKCWLFFHKIVYNSACMAHRPETLHLPRGFRGWPIQRNHAKCCGVDPCCHGNDILPRCGDPYAITRYINRRLCLFLSSRLPDCSIFVLVILLNIMSECWNFSLSVLIFSLLHGGFLCGL